MDPLALIVLATALMLLLIVIGMPIAFAAALAGSVGIVLLQNWATLLYTLGTFPVTRIANFTWVAIPLFILLGNLAATSGVAADAYDMAHKWLGRFRGGLLLATIGASAMIAATTGSGATGTAVMGKIAVPEMEKYGYDRSLSTGATAACGPLGILIPPSASFLIIGILAQLSIGKLFIAGILPGILTALVFMAVVVIKCRLNPTLALAGRSFSWKERFVSLRKGWGVALIFAVVIGGLYSGVATATEVAALGCAVAFGMAFLAIWRGTATVSDLKDAILDAVGVSAMVFAFVIGSGIFSLFITLTGVIPQSVALIQAMHVPSLGVVAFICFIYLLLGMFFDPLSMVIVTVPVFFPIVVGGLHLDPIWYSVITVVMVEMSALTPPVGLNLYIMKAVYPKAALSEIVRGAMWFVLADVVVLALLFVFPEIATWLPSILE